MILQPDPQMAAAFDRITGETGAHRVAAEHADHPGQARIADHIDIGVERGAGRRQAEAEAALPAVDEITVAAEIEPGDRAAAKIARLAKGEDRAKIARLVDP